MYRIGAGGCTILTVFTFTIYIKNYVDYNILQISVLMYSYKTLFTLHVLNLTYKTYTYVFVF